MPQEFQILRCCSCDKFQVHQTKKSTKWQCKVCGEKQSLKKAYFIGSAKDCRYKVQELNFEDGKRKLHCMLEQSCEDSTDVEKRFFESAVEHNIDFDEFENASKSLHKIQSDTPACVGDSDSLWMPKKKQRCGDYPLFKTSNKNVSINTYYKENIETSEIEENTSIRNENTPSQGQSISFNVAFGEHSSCSVAYDTSENSTDLPCDLKIEHKKCLAVGPDLTRKRTGGLKNRGFQLIMNAAKKLSTDM